MRVGEKQTLLRQLVDVGSFYFGRTVTTEIPIAEVIRENKNDVGFG
jgi:hypothetical protein